MPKFKTEKEERKFWETHDTANFFDLSKAAPVKFPNLKPTTTSISLRLPISLLENIRIAANKRDIPYQSFIKTILSDRIAAEQKR